MIIENPEILYDSKRGIAYEFFHLEFNRSILRNFIKSGAACRKFDGKVNIGICMSKTGYIIQKNISSMNIGDYYEGRRIVNIEFIKLKIGQEQHDCVAFIYKLE